MNKDIEFLISPGLWRKTHKIVVAIIISTLLISVGFIIGTWTTVKAVASLAIGFIDTDLLNKALFQYNEGIRQCFPSQLENALNDSDEG